MPKAKAGKATRGAGKGAHGAKGLKASSAQAVRNSMALGMAAPPPHPMTAEQDRFEDEDEPFDDGVH